MKDEPEGTSLDDGVGVYLYKVSNFAHRPRRSRITFLSQHITKSKLIIHSRPLLPTSSNRSTPPNLEAKGPATHIQESIIQNQQHGSNKPTASLAAPPPPTIVARGW